MMESTTTPSGATMVSFMWKDLPGGEQYADDEEWKKEVVKMGYLE